MDANLKSICLIIPPSAFLLDERVFMSLGILKVAGVLEKSGWIVEVVDLSGIANYRDAIRDHAKSSSADFFGITATTPQLPSAVEIGQEIRATRPEARVILGGPHVTLVNAAAKREVQLKIDGRARRAMEKLEAAFDILVAGDGEDAIFSALADHPPKLVDADIPNTPLFLTNARLTELPLPARHLVEADSYHYEVEGERAMSLIAQLGCPFACGFCGGRQSPFLRRVRTRANENVVSEVVHLYKTYGVRGFMFYDDELNVNRQFISLLNLIEKAQQDLNTQWRLRGFIKSQLFTDEQAAAMYRAGFRWILVGFESGSERILENINKKANRSENTRCMEIAHRHGLKVKALMSMGHPGESAETVMATRDWLLEVRPDDFDLTIITTYPGTPYYDFAVPVEGIPGHYVYTYEKTGDLLYSVEIDHTAVADYYKGVPGEYQSYVYTDYLSAPDLVRLRDQVENDVRATLSLPFNQSRRATRYEHSMGQMGRLPSHIVRSSASPA